MTVSFSLMNLSEETLKKIDDVIPRYPEKRSAALMVIHLFRKSWVQLISKQANGLLIN